MSGLRRPLLTATVIRGLRKLLPELRQAEAADKDRENAVRYLHALVRYTQTEAYQKQRDKRNKTVRDAKAKRKAPLP
ncbi:hypothetical protein [Cupriavidus necator]